MSDHDMIIEAVTILKELKVDFDNHLQDHKKYSFYFFTLAIISIISLLSVIFLNK